MNLYFSDTHFNHKFISMQRGFSDVEEMNRYIIEGINSRSTYNDTLYCLGDFVWTGGYESVKSILDQLKFKNLIFIKGNHDDALVNFLKFSNDIRYEIHTDLFIKDSGTNIHLYHYPIFDWDRKFHNQWHLYGHQHEIRSSGVEMMDLPYSHNVNVELNNYVPVSMKDIMEKS
jgi:calcineurin-like phosphoesterase family protein